MLLTMLLLQAGYQPPSAAFNVCAHRGIDELVLQHAVHQNTCFLPRLLELLSHM